MCFFCIDTVEIPVPSDSDKREQERTQPAMESFRTELKETPTPLIAALGSPELQNKVLPHLRTVNEGFVPKLRIASLPRAHRLPVKKELCEKHGTFSNQMQRDLDTYRTQGILKTQWLKKHHELLPAVVLLFDEFDPCWTLLDWQQKETALVDDVMQLKQTVSGGFYPMVKWVLSHE